MLYINWLPVSTSVTYILYCVITPFCNSAGGGDHDTKIDVELTEDKTTSSGGLSGAKVWHRKHNILYIHGNLQHCMHDVPADKVVMLSVVLYGPIPTAVTAAILKM